MQRTITAPPNKSNKYHQSEQPHVRPFRITWHGKTYAVTNVADYHSFQENGQTVHVFSATDGEGTFELKFTNEDMSWFLGV